MIGVVESKFLLVTIICSVPIMSILTVKIMITRRSLGSKHNTDVRTRENQVLCATLADATTRIFVNF